MLKKIISIKSIGKFADYQYEDDVELRKLNIVYGDNGRGKTTLATILRSLKRRDGALIQGRRTLGSTEEPMVKLLFTGETRCFKNGNWDANVDDIEIFDETFITENVHSGNQVDHNQKKNLYRFVVGFQGVKLTRKIDDLNEDNSKQAKKIREKEIEIREHFSGSLDIEKFVALKKASEKDIDEKEREITSLKTVEEIATKNFLHQLSLPRFPLDDLKNLLAARSEKVSKDAAERVQEHIAHCMDSEGENWIESGLGYIKDEECPFCGENINNNGLVEAYQVFFDKAYQDFKKEINNFSDFIRQLFSEDELIDIQSKIASNDELIEFWNDHVETRYPEIDFSGAIQEPWQVLRKNLLKILKAKAAAPLETIKLDDDVEKSIENYEDFSREKIANYNQAIDQVNELIERVKSETEFGDLKQAQAELDSLMLCDIRHKPEVDKLCQDYSELCEEKEDLENAKKQKKDELDQYSTELIEKYGAEINKQLAKCGTGFRLIELDKNYIGGSPRTDYCLQINGVSVNLGNEDTSIDEPSFKNTLSSGDKSALAFSFFMAKLKQDARLSEKIVVIDDPASSLDSQRRNFTCHQIAWLSKNCKQVIVLTHSTRLARKILDVTKYETSPRTLWVKRDGTYSSIVRMDINKIARGEYFKNYYELNDYLVDGPEGDRHMRLVAGSIRPLLEGYLRVRFPGEFKAHERLGNFIEKLSEAEDGDKLYTFTAKSNELSELNHYASRYHHDQNPTADTEPIDDNELSAWVERTLNFIN